MRRIDVVDIVKRNYNEKSQQCDLFDSDAKDVFSFLQAVESGEITPTSDEESVLLRITGIDLSKNGVTDISALCKLTNLIWLDLRDNYISNIAVLSNLIHLHRLGLNNNQISDIRPISNLVDLQVLYLSYNPIKELPDFFLNLSKLKRLVLSNLTIKSIPKSLVDLNLKFCFSNTYDGINLVNTILTEQEIERFKGSHEEILEYYNADKVKIGDAKIVFLGDGGAGKTHTIERIKNDCDFLPPDFNTDRTADIEITPYIYDNRSINIWDFGGQPYMYHLHRLFLTPRTVYAVVLYSRHGNYKRTARYWLHTIENHTKSSDISTFLLENCHDNESEKEIGIPTLEAEFKDIITGSIHYSATRTPKNEFYNKFMDIFDKTADYKFEVRQTVYDAYNKLKNIQENCIAKEKYVKYFNDCCITDNQAIIEALNTFNDLGYFFSATDDTGKLPEYLVLNPQWLFNNIYKIIDKTKQRTKYTESEDHGIVKVELIKEELYEEIKDYEITYLLELMQKFELAYILDHRKIPRVFIPALCSENVPKDLKDIVDSDDGWVFEFQYSYLPDNVLYMLLVRAYRDGDRVCSAWTSGAKMNIEGRNVIIKFDENRKKLSIKPLDEQKDWYNTFKWINDQLTDNSNLQSINYKLGLSCTGYIVSKSKLKPEMTVRFNFNGLIDAWKSGIENVSSSEIDCYEEFSVEELLGIVLTEEEKSKISREIEREKSMNNGVTYNIGAINGQANFGDGPHTLIGGDQNNAGNNMELNEVKGDQYKSVGDMTVNKNSGISENTLNNILSAYATADTAAIEICNKLINNNLMLANEFIAKLFENLYQINDPDIQGVCKTLKDEPNVPGKIKTFFGKIKAFGKNNREEIWATIRTSIQALPAILQILAK